MFKVSLDTIDGYAIVFFGNETMFLAMMQMVCHKFGIIKISVCDKKRLLFSITTAK